MVADLRQFFRRLSKRWGKLPIVAVVERGRRGTHRLHVHLAAPTFLSVEAMRDVWRHGFVYVGDPGKLPGQTSSRRLSAYLAKYVAKQLEPAGDDVRGQMNEAPADDRESGRHRYLVTQGWAPECKRRRFWSIEDGITWLGQVYGVSEHAWTWTARDLPDMYGVVLVYGDEVIRSWLSPPASSPPHSGKALPEMNP